MNGAEVILNNIQIIFKNEVDVTGFFPSGRVDIFHVSIPVGELFEKNSFRVKLSKRRFLKDIQTALSDVPDGQRAFVSFLFGTDGTGVSSQITLNQDVAIRRAGALGRLLRDTGLHEGQFSVGFAAHSSENVMAVYQIGKQINGTENLIYHRESDTNNRTTSMVSGGGAD